MKILKIFLGSILIMGGMVWFIFKEANTESIAFDNQNAANISSNGVIIEDNDGDS